MTESVDESARRTAVTVGEEVEGLAAWVIDRVEDLSLLVMERVAEAAPRSEGVSDVRRVMSSLRRLASPVPRIAGRVAAGTTFGLLMGVAMYRATRHGIDGGRDSIRTDAPGQED